MIPAHAYSQPSPVQVAQNEATFMRKVYAYMTAGLAITALTSFLIAHSPTMISLIFGNRIVFYALLLGELGSRVGSRVNGRRLLLRGTGRRLPGRQGGGVGVRAGPSLRSQLGEAPADGALIDRDAASLHRGVDCRLALPLSAAVGDLVVG